MQVQIISPLLLRHITLTNLQEELNYVDPVEEEEPNVAEDYLMGYDESPEDYYHGMDQDYQNQDYQNQVWIQYDNVPFNYSKTCTFNY